MTALLVFDNGETREMTADEAALHYLAQVTASPSFEARAEALQRAVQLHMDQQAQARRYDDIATAITYADEPAVPRFQEEGRAFRAWRSQVWAFCYWLMDEVAAGRALEPTEAALIEVLPPLELPA